MGAVSGAAWMHDCMFAAGFKHLPEGHHLLNLNLNLLFGHSDIHAR
jgi:hypothetical protein